MFFTLDIYFLEWQECYDESTGYPYYWNMQTNRVTWEMPEEYKNYISNNASTNKKPIMTTAEKVTSSTNKTEKIESKVVEKLQEDEVIILKDDEDSNSKRDFKNKAKKQNKKPARMRKSSSESDEG